MFKSVTCVVRQWQKLILKFETMSAPIQRKFFFFINGHCRLIYYLAFGFIYCVNYKTFLYTAAARKASSWCVPEVGQRALFKRVLIPALVLVSDRYSFGRIDTLIISSKFSIWQTELCLISFSYFLKWKNIYLTCTMNTFHFNYSLQQKLTQSALGNI